MKLIKTNSELVIGRHYWCQNKEKPNDIELHKCRAGVSGWLYFGNNIWAMDKNNQALERWNIVGPVPVPDEKSFIPIIKKWDIWMEGFVVTGQNDTAAFKGSFKGETFQDACLAWVNTLDEGLKTYYSKESNTFWSCRMFANEIDARKSFG